VWSEVKFDGVYIDLSGAASKLVDGCWMLLGGHASDPAVGRLQQCDQISVSGTHFVVLREMSRGWQ